MLLSHTIVSYKFQNTVCHTYIHCVESVIFELTVETASQPKFHSATKKSISTIFDSLL